jgi:hypothetical protein
MRSKSKSKKLYYPLIINRSKLFPRPTRKKLPKFTRKSKSKSKTTCLITRPIDNYVVGVNFEAGKIIDNVRHLPNCLAYANCQISRDAPFSDRVADDAVRTVGRSELAFVSHGYDESLLIAKFREIVSSIKDKYLSQENPVKLVIQVARGKAAKKGFNVEGALFVMDANFPKDDDAAMNFNMPLVAIFEDKVVQSRKSILGSSLEEIPMKNISSVEITSGLIPTVNVYTSGNTLTFRTDVLQGPRFVELLQECLAKRNTGNSNPGSSDVEQLEKLATLLEKGLITREEFDGKKQQILGS